MNYSEYMELLIIYIHSRSGCGLFFYFSFPYFTIIVPGDFNLAYFDFRNIILQKHKCIPLEDLAAEFKLRTQVNHHDHSFS